MKRNKFSLSNYRLTSFDMGQIVPVGVIEILPGDSVQMQSSALIRVTPQLKPLMHPVTASIQHYFVPFRLLWSGWEDFITGESETPPPTITGAAYSEGTLGDYLGVYDDASNDWSALYARAYNAIYNEYFRDKDLISEVSEDSDVIQRCAWRKDYFTASRPWPQRGDAVTLPLGTKAPIKHDGTTSGLTFTVLNGNDDEGRLNASTPYLTSVNEDNPQTPLYADLSDADAIDVRDFREVMALQRYQEARARYGHDHADYLRYIGIRPSDSRLQKPEFLAGGRAPLQFSEVLSTSQLAPVNVGDLFGHGISAMRSNKFRRFFEEHGVLMTLMFVRPRALYVQGLHRKFSKTTKEDYFQKELENIGAQEVFNKELYAAHTSPDDVFAYADRYSEYRSEPSIVTAQMRNSTSYDWHMGRIFSSDPALNQTFIDCNPTKRCFAEQSEDSLWVMVNNSVQARRRVGRRSIGRIM